MSVDQVHQAVEAGAEYMISPNVNEAVIRETKKLDKVSIPGAMTPTEAAFAYECGADIVKPVSYTHLTLPTNSRV